MDSSRSSVRPTDGAAGPDQPIQVRQGDVLLVPVDAIPVQAGIEPRNRSELILAEGEVTGHAHAVRSPDAWILRLGATRYLLAQREVVLTHEEHAPIPLPAGAYRIVIQREFDLTAASSWRQVAD